MKENKKVTVKLFAIALILFFNLSIAFAQPGAIDIVMYGSNNCGKIDSPFRRKV